MARTIGNMPPIFSTGWANVESGSASDYGIAVFPDGSETEVIQCTVGELRSARDSKAVCLWEETDDSGSVYTIKLCDAKNRKAYILWCRSAEGKFSRKGRCRSRVSTSHERLANKNVSIRIISIVLELNFKSRTFSFGVGSLNGGQWGPRHVSNSFCVHGPCSRG